MMKKEKIHTLHPDPAKTNKQIDRDKYDMIRESLLAALRGKELTHLELMEAIFADVKDRFDGGVQWYGETVKLDLEARGIVERTGRNPQKYRLKK